MGVFSENAIIGASAAGGYDIEQSLRFEDGDSPKLTRTPSSAGNRKTWTWSGWVKRGAPSQRGYLFWSGTDISNNNDGIEFDGNVLRAFSWLSGSAVFNITSSAYYRDPSAWYHILVCFNSTESSAANRAKLYVNGERLTAVSETQASLNADCGFFNTTTEHRIGNANGSHKWDGYLAEVHFIDGQALTPASFGETDGATGQWKPKEVTGLTYGTNGFYQSFANTDDPTDIIDSSSNSGTLVDVNAVKSIAEKKIGNSSIYLNGSAYIKKDNNGVTNGWNGANSDGYCIEMWVRPSSGSSGQLVANYHSSINRFYINLNTNNTVSFYWKNSNSSGTNQGILSYTSSGTLADNTWTHLAFVIIGVTGSNPNANNLLRCYIGGVQDGTTGGSGTSNKVPWAMWGSEGGANQPLYIGADHNPTAMGACYLDQIRFSTDERYPDGTTFSPPTAAFSDDSDTALLIQPTFGGGFGKDYSGTENHFTQTNLAATDQVLDSPTNNFATYNPLVRSSSNSNYSQGNLYATDNGSGNWEVRLGTIPLPETGKWYWECRVGNGNAYIGILDEGENIAATNPTGGVVWYGDDGRKRIDGTFSSYGAGYGSANVLGVAVDMDASPRTITFYKDNTTQGSITITGDCATGTVIPYITSIVQTWINFGQDSSFAGSKTAQGNQDGNGIGDFYYTPPSGYLALCTDNLPAPSIADPSKHFNTVLYTGGGYPTSVTGVGHQPDFVWIKRRNAVIRHDLFDSVRGGDKILESSNTRAENSVTGALTFDSDGFTAGADPSYGDTASSGNTFVAWNWKAGGTASSNTDGSITSSVSANTTAGFSIVSWTGIGAGTQAAGSVGHGLSQKPEMVITKSRDDAYNWSVDSILRTSDVGDAGLLYLNTTAGKANDTNVFYTTPDATKIYPKGDEWAGIGQSGVDYITYCFHSVDGYSKVGSYTGNGSSDGTFVYTGFRPMWVMAKCSDGSASWLMTDSVRFPYNVTDDPLFANETSAETNSSTYAIDILSNGFKCRGVNNDTNNSSGNTYIYLAFAETPFKTANAR